MTVISPSLYLDPDSAKNPEYHPPQHWILNSFPRLYLAHPTFFSELTAVPPATLHDEYWHEHVDKVNIYTFRLRLLTSSGSGTDFWPVTILVPVLAPYLDHKKHNFQKKLEKKSCLVTIHSKLFTRKSFIKFIVKCEWKKYEWNQIHSFILCLWELLWFHFIMIPEP
jgi:hypothetical protein